MYIFNTSKFVGARWLYASMVTSYKVQWYSFWYQWIEEVHTYTLVANIEVSSVPYRKSREGLQQAPFGGRVTKNTSGGRGLKYIIGLRMTTLNTSKTLALDRVCFTLCYQVMGCNIVFKTDYFTLLTENINILSKNPLKENFSLCFTVANMRDIETVTFSLLEFSLSWVETDFSIDWNVLWPLDPKEIYVSFFSSSSWDCRLSYYSLLRFVTSDEHIKTPD